MPQSNQVTYQQIPYDHLILVGREDGDYGSTEYLYRGTLGVYKLRIGHSIVDGGKVLYIYRNNKLFLNLFPTSQRMVFAGQNDDGEYYVFRLEGKFLDVFMRKYEF